MARKKSSKALKRRLTFFVPICIFSIFYFIFTFVTHTYNIVELTSKKKELNEYYNVLKTDEIDLKDQIQKFSDKEYLARYARENYSYSTNNEYIIKITEDVEKDIDKTNELLYRNYIILGLSFGLVLVFVYIIKKGFSKKTKKKKK